MGAIFDGWLIEKAWLDGFLALLLGNSPVLDAGRGSGVPIARYLIERGLLGWNYLLEQLLSPNQADQRRMLPIFKRHAGAGAALRFTSGPSAAEQIGSYQGEPVFHASLDSAECRMLLHDNGFDVASHVVEDPDCGQPIIWLARLKWVGPAA